MNPVAVTCGDPAGVGPEVVEAWSRRPESRDFELVLIGPRTWLERISLPGQDVGDPEYVPVPGRPDPEGARIALSAMERAAAGCLAGEFSGVVTCPVSKYHLHQLEFPFPGQTEFFANAWSGTPSMGFAGIHLKLVLATWHIPLRNVPQALVQDPELLRTAVERAVLLGKLSGIDRPRIAVCGLNPHAGEQGHLGEEEIQLLNPVLQNMRKEYSQISDCLPGDSVFYRLREGEFDVAVALYHDQGLAPLKTLEFHTAVNVTLGLPHLRVSPDHGTGFEIAGHGIARDESFHHAVSFISQGIARQRLL